jgi:hypothetical protein
MKKIIKLTNKSNGKEFLFNTDFMVEAVEAQDGGVTIYTPFKEPEVGYRIFDIQETMDLLILKMEG